MTGFVWFARSRAGVRYPLAAGLLAAVLLAMPGGLVRVPFRDDILVQLLPLLSGLAGLLLPMLLVPPSAELEATSVRPMRVLRAGWLAVSTLTLGAVSTMGLRAFAWDTAIVVWRNHLVLCGLAALCTCLLGHYLGWLPGAVFLALSWIYGTQDSNGHPRPWAVLQLPHDSILAAVTAAALCIAGTCLYAIRGARE